MKRHGNEGTSYCDLQISVSSSRINLQEISRKTKSSLVTTNLTHFYIFIYYTCLHVSSITVPIIRRSNCINTSSGMISLRE